MASLFLNNHGQSIDYDYVLNNSCEYRNVSYPLKYLILETFNRVSNIRLINSDKANYMMDEQKKARLCEGGSCKCNSPLSCL